MVDINSCVPRKKGTHSQFVSSERTCKHVGRNKSRHDIRQFKVDGDVFPANSAEEKCDYLLLNDTDKRAYYIELKGSDIEKAISQIENSIKLLHNGIKQYIIYPRIIYRSGTHDIQGSVALKWKQKHHSRAIIRCHQYEEDIS